MNKKKICKFVFICLFLSFVVSYVIEKTGYYEYNLQNKMIMTNEAMERFEKDVKEGKDDAKDMSVCRPDFTPNHMLRE